MICRRVAAVAAAVLAGPASAQQPYSLGVYPIDDPGDGRCTAAEMRNGGCAEAAGAGDELSDEEIIADVVPLRDIRGAIEERLDSRQSGRIHRHIERALVRRTFPSALADSLRRAGNYSDGTPAGSPRWLGSEGAQDEDDPTYVTFGSVLDVSSGGEATDGAVAWLASLVRREAFVGYGAPCRLDLLDDYDSLHDDVCYVGATLDDFVAVRSSEGGRRRDLRLAAEYGVADRGTFLSGDGADWLLDSPEVLLGGRRFDTVFADGLLVEREDDSETVDATADIVMENAAKFLKPGGTIYIVGREPHGSGDPNHAAADALDSVRAAVESLSGYHPARDLPAAWVHRTANSLGLNVYDSTLFPRRSTREGVMDGVVEAKALVDDLDVSEDFRRSLYQMLLTLVDRIDSMTDYEIDAIPAGNDYVIAAELPSPAKEPAAAVEGPSPYVEMEAYEADHHPAIEELDAGRMARGTMEEYRWANGDPTNGLAGRVGVPPGLRDAIVGYVKGLGIWDLMIDTVLNDPMDLNTTRFYEVESPFGGGRNFTWSAKRPDNFYGSDSDMHWFDIADEAAHEDSLRALAAGGFDEVLDAIGRHFGLDHLVTFSIGLLAVSKADKGYIHVDFTQSEGRAFNFLLNLHSPEDAGPELTVVDEDELGNRRRGQVKYRPDFGVLNGDDARHATNECNHRASGGIRLTASIFLAELEESSLDQIAGHDTYYFPFGNNDWIWAQRGRHWNREGTASLVDDRGRSEFEAEDAMEGCAERIGEGREKCTEHSQERLLCYRTCGTFVPDEEFRPGEPRSRVFGW